MLFGIAVLIYLATKLFGPRDFDWTVTFNKDDKNPFGAYVLHTLVQDLFPQQEIQHSYKTIYELYDSIDEPVNFLSISTYFQPDKEDINALLKNIDKGGNAFITAQYFRSEFADTLNLWSTDYYFNTSYSVYSSKDDTASIVFKNPMLADEKNFRFPRNNIHNYFQRFDSARTSVIAVNDLDFPVTIRVKWGKGNIYLNSTPLAFSNAYLLTDDNPEFISRSLSLLPENDLIWTEFYQNGRLEINTPLRFILTTEPLRWAYYLTIFAVLIFMIFETKRKQRIIPVVKPLANTSLEFVTTIGNLYYQTGDHKNIADKMITFFLEHIRTKYWLTTNKVTPTFIHTLAKRSGHTEEEVKKLFTRIENIQNAPVIAAAELMELNKAIEDFNKI